MAYSYNTQSTADWANPSKFNALAEQQGKVVNVGLYPLAFSHEDAVDLSAAGAKWKFLKHSESAITLYKAYLLYTEASSGDAGITLEIGKEADRDYYYTGASEISEAQWYTKELTLLQTDFAAGDTLTFYSPGSKTGTGEVVLTVLAQYLKTAE